MVTIFANCGKILGLKSSIVSFTESLQREEHSMYKGSSEDSGKADLFIHSLGNYVFYSLSINFQTIFCIIVKQENEEIKKRRKKRCCIVDVKRTKYGEKWTRRHGSLFWPRRSSPTVPKKQAYHQKDGREKKR